MRKSTMFQKVLLAATMIMCVVSMSGCPVQKEQFQVVYPTGTQDWGINEDKQIVLIVRFNRDVDMSSLMPGVNVLLDGDILTNAEITITAGATDKEIVITSVKTVSDIFRQYLTLTLRGDGDIPVRSMDGLPLDGDADGLYGGDFIHLYSLVL